jgi:hypothetical protein
MSLDGSFGHFELLCDFHVVAALEKQVCNLLFAPSQAYFAGRHAHPPQLDRTRDSGGRWPTLRALELLMVLDFGPQKRSFYGIS